MSHLTTTRTKRPGFTLVELLAAMLIMAVLAAFFMSALQQVEAQARVERTKAMIARLDQLIMEKYASYRTRTIPLRFAAGTTPKQAATARLNAIRELMRVELPDRMFDLVTTAEKTDADDKDWNTVLDVNNVKLATLAATPSVTRSYKRKVSQLMSQTGKPWSATYENAECLYLIVSAIRNDTSSAMDFFKAGEIQNVDDDAIPEFVDAWGQPISFLRWAPGYTANVATTLQVADRTVSPDPYDPVHADSRWTDSMSVFPYALKPLIFSSGPDRKGDINTGAVMYADALAPNPPNDPYRQEMSQPLVGAPFDFDIDGRMDHIDNLTNHYIEVP